MSKSAWISNCNTDFQTILGPVFTLFRWFGIEFHDSSASHRFLCRVAMAVWMLLTLGICGYRLLFFFPTILINSSAHMFKAGYSTTSFLHWSIEFLNHWIYILAVFIGSWCMAKWSAVKLWIDVEDTLTQIRLSAEDVNRCRKTTIHCIIGCLVAVFLNLMCVLAVGISLKQPTDQLAQLPLLLVYFYSFGSSALFVCVGRIISTAYETISQQLELTCRPPTNPEAVWKYQRQFGIACRAAEELGRTFGFVLFATVSYTFIGFVNASYNLLKSYQQLPQATADGYAYHVIPNTIRMTYTMTEHLFRLWSICHTADLIRSKALSIVPVLQNIRNDLYSRQYCGDESEEVHAFLLEVSETSPTYEVLGLFTLTKQVIISLIGTTLTYLVVLCQFSAAEVKTAVNPMNLNNITEIS